jgi:multidrug efflux pump
VFSTFFIARPIFATVLSILITLVGGVALVTLPVAQYPEITPPTVEVSATYPGANAKVVVDTIAAPIEQQLNGVEGMLYMSSVATNDGNYSLTVTFKPGTNLNIAQVLVQNRVSLAQPVSARLGQAARHRREEKVAQHPDDRQPLLPRWQPRQLVPEQLRHHPTAG